MMVSPLDIIALIEGGLRAVELGQSLFQYSNASPEEIEAAQVIVDARMDAVYARSKARRRRPPRPAAPTTEGTPA